VHGGSEPLRNLPESDFVGQDLLGGQTAQLVRKHQPLVGFVYEVVGYPVRAVVFRLEVGCRDSNLLGGVAARLGLEVPDHRLDAQAGVEDIVDDQQPVVCVDVVDDVLQAVEVDVELHRSVEPPLAQDRLALAKDGSIVYRFRKPWRNGKQAVVMDPMTFLSRLAALVPPPRFHMLTYYGVLAPAASRRDEIVPGSGDTEELSGCCTRSSRAKVSSTAAERRKRYRPERLAWAELLRRTWREDTLRCPCGGRRRVLSMVFNTDSIVRILRHLGLPHQAPARAPPRPVPQALPFSA